MLNKQQLWLLLYHLRKLCDLWVGHEFLDMVRLGRMYPGSSVCLLCQAYLVKIVPLPHLHSLLAHHKLDLNQNTVVYGEKSHEKGNVHLHSSHCSLSDQQQSEWFSTQRVSKGVSQRVVCFTIMWIKGPPPDIWTRISMSRAQVSATETRSLRESDVQ